MSGFGEAHDVYVVFGHVAMDFVTFPLGVDALYVEGADAVGGFVFDGSTWGSGRFGFLSPRRGLVLLSALVETRVASSSGACRFASKDAFWVA